MTGAELGAEYLLNFGAMGIFAAYLMLKDRQHDKLVEKIMQVVENNTVALSKFNDSATSAERSIAAVAIGEITDLRELRRIQEAKKLEVKQNG
jgi:hypothetical protein